MRRLLVVKLADFGDALLTTPALRALRRRYPEARIDVLTTPAAAVAYRHCGLVDDVVVFDKAPFDRPWRALGALGRPAALARELRARRFDAVLLLHHLTTRYGALKHAALTLATGAPVRAGLAPPGSWRGAFLSHAAPDPGYDRAHVADSALRVARLLDAPPADRRLAFVPGARAEAAADRLVGPRRGAPRVAIHPGAGPFSPARRWPPERFAAVADALHGDGARIVLVGRAGDDTAAVAAASHAPVRDLTDATDLPALGAVLARCDLLVANDGGVMHLATAMGTPVVAVFGPSNPVAWGPWHPGPAGRSPHRVVALDLPCRPCFYVGHRLGSPQGCPTRDCLSWLPAARVVAAARGVLGAG